MPSGIEAAVLPKNVTRLLFRFFAADGYAPIFDLHTFDLTYRSRALGVLLKVCAEVDGLHPVENHRRQWLALCSHVLEARVQFPFLHRDVEERCPVQVSAFELERTYVIQRPANASFHLVAFDQ